MYAYYLGGKDNFPADREAAEQALSVVPFGREVALANRQFPVRAVTFMTRSGYKRLRHPIYTGLLAMYAGIAIVTGEWLAAAGFAMAVFAYWRKLRLEETNLNVAFGAEYDAYRRESWALLPGLF